jgi:glycosyltransferase involved in cell wall biosynthesis
MATDNKSQLALSVVVPTYNRAEILRDTLRHLAEQELDPASYEVVVIDDGSTDHTRAVVEEWVSRAPFRLRYQYQTNHGPGHAYNRGMEAAEAPILLLTGDDMFMASQALKAHLAMHRVHPEQEVAVFGPAALSPTLDQSVFLRKFDRTKSNAFAGLRELPYYRFWACNISAKREFVLRYGAFPEEIGRGGRIAHQDVELGYQLSLAGLRILYSPDAIAYHHQVMTYDQACQISYLRGVSFGELRERVGQPEIAVAYHVWAISTLRDHLRVWFGPRRRYVSPSDRNPALLLGRYLIRGLAFNALTIRLLWRPLVERAERHPAIARLMRDSIYRGLVAYHFFRGYRESRTWTGVAAAQGKQA